MSWVDGPDDSVTDQFPVDTLVKELKATVGDINSFCQGKSFPPFCLRSV